MSAYSQFGYNYPASAVPALSSTAVQLLGGSSGSSGGGPPQGGTRVSSSYLSPSSLTISPGSSTTSSTTTPHGPTTPGSITGLPPSATTRDTMLPGGTRGGNPSSRLSSPASSTSSIGSSPTGGVGVGGTSLPLLPGSTPASTSGLGAGSGAVGGGSTTSTGIAAPPRTSCCETGRPIATDPHTGQSICSCQYTPSTAAALLSYPRMTAGLPHPSSGGDPLYGSPYAVAAAAQAYAMPLTADTSAFYSPLNYDLKDRADAWSAIAQPTPCYPYDPTMGYAYGQSALAQRKNATREATSTLKAWLTEHIKNPYPTKGEKIMLAIITKMTLTQVSTWFANARRRLKKENKMVWSPRNRSDEEGEGGKDSDDDMDDDVTDKDGGDVRHGAGSIGHGDEDDEIHVIDNGLDDVNPLHNDKLDATPPACAKQQQPIGSMNTGTMTPLGASGAASPNKTGSTSPVKPRIWSIADVATSGHSSIKEPTGSYPHTVQHRPLPGAPGMMNGVAGGGAGGEVSAAALGYKDPYGHIPGMNGFRPWIHSSPYPCTTSHHPAFTSALSQTHVAGSAPPIPGTLGLPPSVSGSSGAPSVSALGGSTLPPSGLPTASLGGSGSAAAAAAASGLLRPYPISARAEVH